jgi:hypothetical protein
MLLLLRPKKVSLAKYILALAPMFYWKLDELSGTTAINYGTKGTAGNGTYSGPTLAQEAAPGGGLAPSFDGVNDRVDIHTATLASEFNPLLCTVLIWFKHAADTWIDGEDRTFIQLAVDANNCVGLWKALTNNTLIDNHIAGGTIEAVSSTAYANTSWHLSALTVSKAADEFTGYVDGVQIDITQGTLGTWVGTISSSYTFIASYNGAGYFGKGNFAHAAVFNKVLTQSQLANIYSLGRV